MKRASTKEKKLQRRATILKKARAWISGHAFSEIRLADMARELGLVKGTLYLYFPTKQDLFSSILIEEMEAWWASFRRAPVTTPGPDLVEGLSSRELLVRLLSSLHMAIEPGLSPDGLRSFKMWFLDFAGRATHDLEVRYPSLEGRSFLFLMGVYSLTLGASQLAFPPENVRSFVCSENALQSLRIDFRDFLTPSIDALYKGYGA
ncbi:MAG TPA: TetR family transcriptional regulator [Syntrophorhabdales bacterium]|nr:TetR family transcriptional regulator [Syntrophorhabdales bacterium]